MTHIGDAVRELRARSPYTDLRTFAEHACVTYECMRKVEVGERVPTVDTLIRIIRAVDLKGDEARELMRVRDLDHAEREGILDRGVTDYKLNALANKAFGVIEQYLAEFEMGFEEADANDLRQKLFRALREEFCG